ncbi:MAG: Crp/Fnr family transcriptional regulator [Pseudomonadota bacterium]
MSRQFHTLFQNATPREIAGNSFIFRTGDDVVSLHLVEDGCLALERHLESGVVTCLQRATSGQILAEASIYAHQYHCAARALAPTRVRSVSVKSFRKALLGDAELAEDWARHLAHTVQATRFQAELRSIRTVADRLDAWIGQFGDVPNKGQWKSLAAELAVSQEALYREMARRRVSS